MPSIGSVSLATHLRREVPARLAQPLVPLLAGRAVLAQLARRLVPQRQPAEHALDVLLARHRVDLAEGRPVDPAADWDWNRAGIRWNDEGQILLEEDEGGVCYLEV